MENKINLPKIATAIIPTKKMINKRQQIISVHPLFLIGPLKVGSYFLGSPVKKKNEK